MEKYIKALLTKCTCMTKTPIMAYHETGCAYKTAWENYHKGENKLNKEQWVKEAYKYLVSITGEWDYPEGEYNKTRLILGSFGVSQYTLNLMKALQWIYEYPPHDVDLSDTEAAAFCSLKDLILERLEEEIGDKFEIEVL